MDNGQVSLGNLRVATFGNGKVLIPAFTKAGVTAPIVSNDQRPRRNGAFDEPTERVGAAIWDYGEPDAPGIASVFPVVELGAGLSVAHFDGTGNENLMVNTPAFSTRSSADPGFIHLNMVFWPSADPVLVRPHHAGAKLVEDAEGGFISGEAKLPLELHSRYAGRLAGDQIGGPEPCAQRHVAALHNGADRQASVPAAFSAAENTGTGGDAERLAYGMAIWADEPVTPASLLHVGGTRRFIGEKPLKLRKRLREGQVIALKDVHGSTIHFTHTNYP